MVRAAAVTSPNVVSELVVLVGLTITATRVAVGTISRRSSKLLCHQLAAEKIDTGHIAARPSEARDKAKLDRILADDENNWDCRGCRLGRYEPT